MTYEDFSDAVDRAAESIERDYLDRDVAAHTVGALREARDALAQISDPKLFAERVTSLLRSESGDLHLGLIHHPEGTPNPTTETDYDAYWTEQSLRTAGGVRSVTRVEGSTAVIELGPVLALPEYSAPYVAGAMALARGAALVVLDLRGCVGGTPETAALICSYFFGEEPVHLTSVHGAKGVRQFWTAPVVLGERLGRDVPLGVLVSGQTFSGGEELAFNLQELSRCTVVGERTGGGAHPRIGVRVHPEFELAVPVARPVSPRTESNWEGRGVQPDIECDSEEALTEAISALAPLPAA